MYQYLGSITYRFTTILSPAPPSDVGHSNGEILISRLNMTRKQYYTRISQLRDAGLITRKRARFVLTSFGRVVYETHKTIGVAIQNRWKLEAIDSIQTSQLANRMPTEERHKLINTLVGDCDKIRDILLCHCEAEKMIMC